MFIVLSQHLLYSNNNNVKCVTHFINISFPIVNSYKIQKKQRMPFSMHVLYLKIIIKPIVFVDSSSYGPI